MGFEPTTPVFERAKTIHALDGAATVIGPGITNYTSPRYRIQENPIFLLAPRLLKRTFTNDLHCIHSNYSSLPHYESAKHHEIW
jgi:hypothetical protein